jgi:hypothetical protein
MRAPLASPVSGAGTHRCARADCSPGYRPHPLTTSASRENSSMRVVTRELIVVSPPRRSSRDVGRKPSARETSRSTSAREAEAAELPTEATVAGRQPGAEAAPDCCSPGYCWEAAEVAVSRPAAAGRLAALTGPRAAPCSRAERNSGPSYHSPGPGCRARTCTARRLSRSGPARWRRRPARWPIQRPLRRTVRSQHRPPHRARGSRLPRRSPRQRRRRGACRRRHCWPCSDWRHRWRSRIAAAPTGGRRRRHPGIARRSSRYPARP